MPVPQQYRSKTYDVYIANGRLAIRCPTWSINPNVTPEQWDEEYDRRPNKVLRDIICDPQHSEERALRDPELFTRNASRREHPLNDDDSFKPWFKPDPRASYYLHYDTSTGRTETADDTGVGMSHFDPESGRVIVDLAHFIPKVPNIGIDFDRLLNLGKSLRERGFNIVLVSFDSFQSYYLMRRFNKEGFKTTYTSPDKTTLVFDTFFDLFLDHKLDYYYHPILDKETKALRIINGERYDHPSGQGGNGTGGAGSKDVLDGVACSVFNCFKAYENKIEIRRRTDSLVRGTKVVEIMDGVVSLTKDLEGRLGGTTYGLSVVIGSPKPVILICRLEGKAVFFDQIVEPDPLRVFVTISALTNLLKVRLISSDIEERGLTTWAKNQRVFTKAITLHTKDIFRLKYAIENDQVVINDSKLDRLLESIVAKHTGSSSDTSPEIQAAAQWLSWFSSEKHFSRMVRQMPNPSLLGQQAGFSIGFGVDTDQEATVPPPTLFRSQSSRGMAISTSQEIARRFK